MKNSIKGQGCPVEGCACLPTFAPAISRSIIVKTNNGILGKIDYYQNKIDPQLKRKLHVKRICKFTPT